MNASCGGEIFGVSNQPGSHLGESADLPGMRSKVQPALEPEMLAKLYPISGDGQEAVIGWRAAFNTSPINHHLPCEQGVIYYLSLYEDADEQQHTVIVSWDTATGSYVEHPLVDDNGAAIDPAAFEFVGYDSGSLRNGKLEWCGAGGYVMSTDVATGATTRRFAINSGSADFSCFHVVFGPDSISTLNDPADGKTPVVFRQFERETGDEVTSLTLDGISEHLSLDLVIRGMAVRPGG
jgi:hypothetical protein